MLVRKPLINSGTSTSPTGFAGPPSPKGRVRPSPLGKVVPKAPDEVFLFVKYYS